MTFLALLAGCLVGVVQASFFEWMFHRFWLHRPLAPREVFTAHTLVHHQLCKFEDTFHVTEPEQAEALSFQWWGGPVLIGINLLPWLGLAWGLSTLGVALPAAWFVAAVGATIAVYYVAYESLHYRMHRPGQTWVERTRGFRAIKRHHLIHHVRMNRNLNVILPLADRVLGTLVTEMPVAVATPRAARRTARRHSRYGTALREEAAGAAEPVAGVAVPHAPADPVR
jgi:hypothetical protein